MKNSIKIFVSPANIGSKLTLEINDNTIKPYMWMVKDEFNGETRETFIEEPIYGFFLEDDYVNLTIIDIEGEKEQINNVLIRGGKD